MRLPTFAAAGLLLLSPLAASYAATINQLVVFGDSLSDNGNAAAALGGQFAYNGSSNYAANAATDGPNTNPPIPAGGPTGLWIDQLAAKLSLADPTPIVSSVGGTLVPNLSGTNFAVASALTGSNPSFNLATLLTNPAVPYTADQVNIFSTLNANHASASSLYVFWAGSNDILQGNNPLTAANNIMSNIQTIASEGGKYFLWVNEPDLGQIPVAVAAGTAASAAATAASNAYNAQQAADLAALTSAGLTVIDVNVNSLLGNVTLNTTTPAMGLTGQNPDDYLYWDGMHPTTEGDSYIAALADQDLIAAGLATGSASPTPEPASLGIAAIGLLGCALATRFRS